MDVRRPIWIQRVRAPGAEAFAILFALEALARALVVSVLPVEALRLLGTVQGVSLLFLGASFAGLIATLLVPALVRATARRWVYTLGALILAAAPAAFAVGEMPAFGIGLAMRVVGVVMLTVCLSLYILDRVPRSDYVRAEPMRLFYAAGAWTVGPALGAWLASRHGPWAAYAASAAAALLVVVWFWVLRVRDDTPLTHFKGRAPGPVTNLGRYFRQPRLVFAWVISTGRYIWWVMFFVYVPIMAVELGLGLFGAGLLISGGSACLFLLPLFARGVRRFGIRGVMMTGFAVSGICTVGIAFAFPWPMLAAGLVLVAALAMVSNDAVGNTPFMYAVRRHERAEMTSVYSTYRDAGDITAPSLFALLLGAFALPAVFAATGVLMFGLTVLSRRLHPRFGRVARAPRIATTPGASA